MDWLMGKSTGNHWFSHELWGFPVIFPLHQSVDSKSVCIIPCINPSTEASIVNDTFDLLPSFGYGTMVRSCLISGELWLDHVKSPWSSATAIWVASTWRIHLQLDGQRLSNTHRAMQSDCGPSILTQTPEVQFSKSMSWWFQLVPSYYLIFSPLNGNNHLVI